MLLFEDEIKSLELELARIQSEIDEYHRLEQKLSESFTVMDSLAKESEQMADKLFGLIIKRFPDLEKAIVGSRLPQLKPETEGVLASTSNVNEPEPEETPEPEHQIKRCDFVQVISEPKKTPSKQKSAIGLTGYVDSINSLVFPNTPIMVHFSHGTGFYSPSNLKVVDNPNPPKAKEPVAKPENEQEEPEYPPIAISTNGVTNVLIQPKSGKPRAACIGFRVKTKENGLNAWEEFLTTLYPDLLIRSETSKDSVDNPYGENAPRYLLWVVADYLDGKSLPSELFTYNFAANPQSIKPVVEPEKQEEDNEQTLSNGEHQAQQLEEKTKPHLYRIGQTVVVSENDEFWKNQQGVVISHDEWEEDSKEWIVRIKLDDEHETQLAFLESELLPSQNDDLDF